MKRVAIGGKPAATAQPQPADEWVKNRQAEPEAGTGEAKGEPMKRLTIDVPESLHTRIKTQCAARRVKMADEIRELLEKHFAEGNGAG